MRQSFEMLGATRRGQTGFSLIELLIVIAIILIILGVAIAQLNKARISGQEMAAQKAISTIHTAQVQYYSTYGQFAMTLLQLGPPAEGSPGPKAAELIQRDLASGEKGGYRFILTQTEKGYSIQAAPVQFGTTGFHTFFSDQSTAIHSHSGPEPATANDPLFGESPVSTK